MEINKILVDFPISFPEAPAVNKIIVIFAVVVVVAEIVDEVDAAEVQQNRVDVVEVVATLVDVAEIAPNRRIFRVLRLVSFAERRAILHVTVLRKCKRPHRTHQFPKSCVTIAALKGI